MPDIRDILINSSSIQGDVRKLGLTAVASYGLALESLYELLITDAVLRDTTRQLFHERHYALAVEEAYKCLNNSVKTRSGLNADGADLMRTAFSLKKPFLRLNQLKTDSQRNQQLGYMDIMAGCMTGIRNPRAHEHRYLDEPLIALEMLCLANHLLRFVANAKRARASHTRSKTP